VIAKFIAFVDYRDKNLIFVFDAICFQFMTKGFFINRFKKSRT
jgi:hypothetical protein